MKYVGWLLLWLFPLATWANHIIGGDITLAALDKNKPGYYRIQLVQYWETAALQGTSNQDPIVNILIFRKRNPILIEKLQVDLRTTTPLRYANAACASQFKLQTTQAIYYRDYQFDISQYSDPDGYYIVWERCCRNNAMTNLASSANVGMMLYMEFPPMSGQTAPIANSSPQFALPDGAYICINKPFTFAFSASDVDGDQLRYSLVTPFQGYTNAQQINPDDVPKASYPTVRWAPGFSDQNAIPGSKPLTIDMATGQLSVQANRQGVFLFTVQCEEFRNGQRIGLVRRDFQLPVIDCSMTRLSPAVIRANDQVVNEVSLCASQQAVKLAVEDNSAWAFQWQKDGISLPNEQTATLLASEEGRYTVIKSLLSACSSDTVSQPVQIKRVAAPKVSITLSATQPLCMGESIWLITTAGGPYTYRWEQDKQVLTGQNTDRLLVQQSGLYRVRVQVPGTACEATDSLQVNFNARPQVQLKASSTTLCLGDSVLLSVDEGAGLSFQWNRNGVGIALTGATNRFKTTIPGEYSVKIINDKGCASSSTPIVLTQVDKLGIVFDSIPPLCNSAGTPVLLQARPAGGSFAGAGVANGLFYAAQAGAGRHQITYTVKAGSNCLSQQSRWIDVSPDLQLTVKPVYTVQKGDTVHLLAKVNANRSNFRWEPTTNLDQSQSNAPVCTPTASITYVVTATSPVGCSTSAVVAVNIAHQLFIPTAFSPNGDGLNDTWVIQNIAAFAECEVSVYNRWGETIFFSKGYRDPWDGTYVHQRVEPGVYAYVVKLTAGTDVDKSYKLTGQLTILDSQTPH